MARIPPFTGTEADTVHPLISDSGFAKIDTHRSGAQRPSLGHCETAAEWAAFESHERLYIRRLWRALGIAALKLGAVIATLLALVVVMAIASLP